MAKSPKSTHTRSRQTLHPHIAIRTDSDFDFFYIYYSELCQDTDCAVASCRSKASRYLQD